jgi:hypothetical protein
MRALIGAIVAGALANATPAAACSMCWSILAEARKAYYETTVFLALLPFLLFAAIFLMLRRAGRAPRAPSTSGADPNSDQTKGRSA